MKKIVFLLLIALSFSGCEKDDICVEETTPRLILEFYDITNPSVKKNVTNLLVTGVGETSSLGTFNGVSKVELPLKITDDLTKYSLILNSTSTSSSVLPNEDFLQFNYTRNNVYVNRACGYKTIFTLNSPNGIYRTDPSTPDGYWMQLYNIQTLNIDTENEVHVKIYI
jgi:Family of unknown function (DUF6452)